MVQLLCCQMKQKPPAQRTQVSRRCLSCQHFQFISSSTIDPHVQTLKSWRAHNFQKLPLPEYPTHWRMDCQPNSMLVQIFCRKNHHVSQAEWGGVFPTHSCSDWLLLTDSCFQPQRLVVLKEKGERLRHEKPKMTFCHQNIARNLLKPENLLQTEKKDRTTLTPLHSQEPREMRSEGLGKKNKISNCFSNQLNCHGT